MALRQKQMLRRVGILGVDQTHAFKVIPLGEPFASIYGVRVHDNIAGVWYNVSPEGQQAYCTPGAVALHVVFGGMNVGDVDGYIWGKLTDDEGKVIIPQTPQWCPLGQFVWWELTFNMPTRDYLLGIEEGH